MIVIISVALWIGFAVIGLILSGASRWSARRPMPTGRAGHPAGGPHPVPVGSPRVDRPRLDRRPVVRGTSQILFAASDGESLRMDCVLIGDDTVGATPGSLLTVRLFPPTLPSPIAPFENILERWAEEVRVVDLELRPCAEGWRLRLDDGHARVNLEISQPTSVG